MALVERASERKRATPAAEGSQPSSSTAPSIAAAPSARPQRQKHQPPPPLLPFPSPRGSRGRRSLGAGAEHVRELPRAKHVGILAMEVYFPDTYVEQADLEVADGAPAGKYTSGLGQLRLGFSASDAEDAVSMALTAANRLLEKTNTPPSRVGSLQVGTESNPDRSKSVKTALMKLFEPHGVTDVDGVDCVNACFGGTAALLSAVNWVESRAWDGERLALVVAADVAVYAAGPARPAGGGGAVAMLVGPDAPLDLERGLSAASVRDEWDFYKPAGCGLWPVVDGTRSVAAYLRGLDECWAALCDKADARLEAAAARGAAGGLQEGGGSGGEEEEDNDDDDDDDDYDDDDADDADDRLRQRQREKSKPQKKKKRPPPPFSLADVDHVVMHAPYGKLLRKGFARMVAADERRRKAREEGGGEGGEAGEEGGGGGGGASGRTPGPGPGFDERAAVKATSASFDEYVGPSSWLAAEVGNMYAASVHAGLAALVEARGKAGRNGGGSGGGDGDGRSNGDGGNGGNSGGSDRKDTNGSGSFSPLEGARILVYSYGSGAAACLFSVTARRTHNAQFTLEKLASSLRISEALARRKRADPASFTAALSLAEARWGACDYRPSDQAIAAVAPGVWYLERVDERYRRTYERKKPLPLSSSSSSVAKEDREEGEGEKEGREDEGETTAELRPFPPPPSSSRLAAGASADNLAQDLLEKMSAG